MQPVNDPHLKDAEAAQKFLFDVLNKKKTLRGVFGYGSEGEGVYVKELARTMFHWAKKSKTYQEMSGITPVAPDADERKKPKMSLKPLTFEYGGDQFSITFRRFTKDGPDHLIRKGGKTPKTKPYTEVYIEKMRPGEEPNEVLRTWTVGCNHKDTYIAEQGRRAALRLALYDDPRGDEKFKLSRDFKAAVWDAYFRRWQDGKWRVDADAEGRD